MSSPYLSGLLGGGSLSLSFSAGQQFDDVASSTASSAHSSHSAATLSHLLSHASSPYSFDSTAASFLSKFVNRPPSDAITTASVIPISPSSVSSSGPGSVFPMPYQQSGLSAAASLRLKSGSSCHQCKTNKDPPHLYFCSTKQDTATGKRNCRKKYCVACISRWYKQLGMTGMPGIMPPNGPGWSCPSCCGQCVCAACDRKKEKANRKAAEEGGAADGAADEGSQQCESDANSCCKTETAGRSEVNLGVKRERSECSETDEGCVSLSPAAKHAKMDISPPLNAVSASAISFTATEQKDRSPSTLLLPRPPPGYNRLQSEPNMPAFASPVQPIRTVTAAAQIAQAIVAPLPPHSRPQPRSTPAPFQVPALPLSSSSSSSTSGSSTSSSSSTPLFFDPMQEAAVRAISRFYHSQQQQQQQLQANKAYQHATAATAYDHMRRVSDEGLPSLTNFSSSNSSSVSTPIPNTPPTHFTSQEDASLAFALDGGLTAHVTAAGAAGAGMQLKALPAQPLPLLSSASRAITVPVTSGETDRHTAVRAIQSIGLLNFDIGGPSPPTLSLAASPSLSPVVSVPSSPRSLTAWRSSLSFASSSAAHLSSHFDALTSDPFHPSPLFNPLLPAGGGSTSSTNTPRHVGGQQTPVQFWIKSGINSLCGTPRAGQLAAGASSAAVGRMHGSRGGSMGEMEFQALFN